MCATERPYLRFQFMPVSGSSSGVTYFVTNACIRPASILSRRNPEKWKRRSPSNEKISPKSVPEMPLRSFWMSTGTLDDQLRNNSCCRNSKHSVEYGPLLSYNYHLFWTEIYWAFVTKCSKV